MVSEGAEDFSGGELDDVGVVDVVCVGGAAGYFALKLPAVCLMLIMFALMVNS